MIGPINMRACVFTPGKACAYRIDDTDIGIVDKATQLNIDNEIAYLYKQGNIIVDGPGVTVIQLHDIIMIETMSERIDDPTKRAPVFAYATIESHDEIEYVLRQMEFYINLFIISQKRKMLSDAAVVLQRTIDEGVVNYRWKPVPGLAKISWFQHHARLTLAAYFGIVVSAFVIWLYNV